MHIITPYDPWSPKKKKKTWQEEAWEQQQIAEIEAKILAEASSRTLPPNSPDISVATAGPAVNAPAGAGNAPVVGYFQSQDAASVPTVDFSATPSATGPAPFTVTFLNLSSPNSLNFWTWNWNFNDGTGSTDKNPQHTYWRTGSFNVGLTGSSPNGTVVTQSVKISYVSSSRFDMPPTVVFAPLQTTGSIPLTVQFANRTQNYAATGSNIYKWTFSGSYLNTPGQDGALVYPITTSVLTSPSITFLLTGSYSAKLELTGSYGVTGSLTQIYCVSASL